MYTYFWKTLPVGDLILLDPISLAFSKLTNRTELLKSPKNCPDCAGTVVEARDPTEGALYAVTTWCSVCWRHRVPTLACQTGIEPIFQSTQKLIFLIISPWFCKMSRGPSRLWFWGPNPLLENVWSLGTPLCSKLSFLVLPPGANKAKQDLSTQGFLTEKISWFVASFVDLFASLVHIILYIFPKGVLFKSRKKQAAKRHYFWCKCWKFIQVWIVLDFLASILSPAPPSCQLLKKKWLTPHSWCQNPFADGDTRTLHRQIVSVSACAKSPLLANSECGMSIFSQQQFQWK